ncbi:unnamed protein product [Aphanomyces euteiches]|uniref:WRKY19-like zinc finger domain-containing protein n=1 Tax=Aphanomyces euteiches TaxID=100861 RepID=A0A6G0X5Y1_9STRA|nr:hypothetical protein Ae201684_008090 [Aphanomyces euteiches]KAH9074404.1 hypothetical protein Ae201684P_022212 [Aphanomyces euteiches]
MSICQFNLCNNPVLEAGSTKCEFHRHRAQCSVPDCFNQVYARQLCARHGGKRKCEANDCEATAQANGFCVTHGGTTNKRFCIVQGCAKQAQLRQRCVRHGGGRYCKVTGCSHFVRLAGLCSRHSPADAAPTTPVDPTRCKYAYKPCPNERTTKKNGELHSLCEFHRAKTNAVQQKYNAEKHRKTTVALPSLPPPPPVAPAEVSSPPLLVRDIIQPFEMVKLRAITLDNDAPIVLPSISFLANGSAIKDFKKSSFQFTVVGRPVVSTSRSTTTQ